MLLYKHQKLIGVCHIMSEKDKRWDCLGNALDEFTPEGIKKSKGLKKIATGFSELDEILGGGIPYNSLTVLGALPGLGKSTFMFQVAEHMAKQGVKVLIFSMEMTATQIMAKSISRETFIQGFMDESKAVKANEFMSEKGIEAIDDDKWKTVYKAKKNIAEISKNIFISEWDSTKGNIGKIVKTGQAFCEDSENKNDKKIIMIDYLQILSPETQQITDTRQTNDVLDGIKSLLKYAPVFLISSLNRESYDKGANMASFKNSGNIEYTADVLLAIEFTAQNDDKKNTNFIEEQKAKNPREVCISVLKQRYGKTGVKINFDYYASNDFFIQENDELARNSELKIVMKRKSEDNIEMQNMKLLFSKLKYHDRSRK